MPSYTVNAIVLRRINFGETDRIVTLYTRERGKLSSIAKGARKAISRLSGSTETFIYGRFHLAEGRNLEIITQVEVKESLPRIRADLHRSAYAMYMVEIVEKMVEEHEANPEMFDLLLSALYLMERPNDPEKITHMFELQFMKMLGYQPILDRCIRCRKPQPGDELFFSPSMGGLVCRNCGPLPEDAIPVTMQGIEVMHKLMTADARETEHMDISRDVMHQIARVMRWYIRYRTDRELKSIEFIQTLRLDS